MFIQQARLPSRHTGPTKIKTIQNGLVTVLLIIFPKELGEIKDNKRKTKYATGHFMKHYTTIQHPKNVIITIVLGRVVTAPPQHWLPYQYIADSRTGQR